MNRRFAKRTLLTAVSLALIYYNVAWAVLRCPHQENHHGKDIAFTVSDHTSHAHDDQVTIDCSGVKYHTEALAGPSPAPELFGPSGLVVSALDILPSLTTVADQQQQRFLRPLFIGGSSPPFRVPQYLSLSVLRF